MQSFATANGAPVLGGIISMPRGGVWRAELDLRLDDVSEVSGDITVRMGDLEWKGVAEDAGVSNQRVHVRMVGGKRGMPKPTTPRFYHAIPAKVVAQDLLAEGGEQLSATADGDKLGTILPLWTRTAGVVSEGFEQLLDELGATWRVLRDGTIWLGVDTWPTATDVKDIAILDEMPSEARIDFTSETPNLLPGMTFRDRRVSRIEIHLGPDIIHTKAWFEGSGAEGTGDLVRVAFERIVRQATRHFDYFATYSGKVVSQNGDGTLELRLEAPELPGMSRIPIRAGSMTLKVKSNAEVNVVFLNGSPAKPAVTYVDPKGLLEASLDPTTKLTVNAVQVITQNGRPLARVGDMVQVISTPPGTPAIGQILTGNNLHRG